MIFAVVGLVFVGVIGLGYVGLPLAMEFAKAGYHVIGYDVSRRVVDALMAGQSHIQDVPAAEVAEMVADIWTRCDQAMPGSDFTEIFKFVREGKR